MSILNNFRHPLFYEIISTVLAFVVTITLIIICIYLCIFFIKKTIKLFNKSK